MDDESESSRRTPPRAALNLPRRICAALDRDGLRTVDALLKVDRDHLRKLPGLGSGSITEIEVALALYGLALKPRGKKIMKKKREQS